MTSLNYLWFNAWKFDKEDAVRRALMMRILEELKIGFVWQDILRRESEDSIRFKKYIREKFNIEWALNADIIKVNNKEEIIFRRTTIPFF